MPQPQMTPNPERDEPRQLRGLYKNVKVSVRTLNIAIIALVLIILVFVAFDLRHPGLQITFDSRGGSDVAPQIQMYGEPLNLPESPTREGYEFAGWHKDHACFEPWNIEVDTIQSDMTLYAGWEKAE